MAAAAYQLLLVPGVLACLVFKTKSTATGLAEFLLETLFVSAARCSSRASSACQQLDWNDRRYDDGMLVQLFQAHTWYYHDARRPAALDSSTLKLVMNTWHSMPQMISSYQQQVRLHLAS